MKYLVILLLLLLGCAMDRAEAIKALKDCHTVELRAELQFLGENIVAVNCITLEAEK